MYASVDAAPMSGQPCVSIISPEHLAQQESIGLIRKCDRKLVKRFGRAMHAYEPATAERTHRLRPLLHPMDVNEFAEFEGEMSLESTAEHMHDIAPQSMAICDDFTAGYWQGGLARDVQYYYGFIDQTGQCYVYCRMVMGCKVTANTMQVVARVLATARQDPADLALVRLTVHIDNVRFLFLEVDRVRGERVARIFRENCTIAKTTLNVEATNVPHRIGPFCGVIYDYHNARMWATPKTLVKLERATKAFTADTSIKHMMELFGLMFHLTTILRPPLATYYHILKWYRKRTAEYARGDAFMSDSARIWPSTLKQLKEWTSFLQANTPVGRPIATPGDKHLFTDASNVGWGAYLILPSGTVRIAAASWTPLELSRNINEREAMAVDNALRAFADYITSDSFHLHIDNTSVIWGLAKGRSNRWNMNTRVTEILATLKLHNATCAIHYVNTRENPADDPSRNPWRYAHARGGAAQTQLPSAEQRAVQTGRDKRNPIHFVRSCRN